MDSSGDYID